MNVRLSCPCGTTLNVPDKKSSVRCPECERVLKVGGGSDKRAIANPQAKKGRVDPAQAAEARLHKRESSSKPAESSFQTVGEATNDLRSRKTKRLVEKPKTGSMEADINPFPPFLRAWIDPAMLLWLPLLAPAFAFTFGTVAFGLRLLPFGAVAMVPAIFGTWLGLAPTSYVATMWSEMICEWSRGADRDPEWPSFDVYEALRRFAQWVGCIIVSAAMGYGIYRGLYGLANQSPGIARLPIERIAVLVAFAYLPYAVLAAALWDSLLAIHPLAIGLAAWRMRRGVVGFWLEYATHFAALYWGYQWVLRVKQASLIDGAVAWVAWWAVALLSISRLVRLLGRFYFRNAKSVGWFR